VFTLPETDSLLVLIIVFLGYFLVHLASFVYGHLHKQNWQWLSFPSLWLVGLLTIITSLLERGYAGFAGLAIMGVAISFSTRLWPHKWSDFLGVPLILGGFGLLANQLYVQGLVTTDLIPAGIFLLVFLVYAVLYDRERPQEMLRTSNLLGLVGSGLTSVLLVADQRENLVLVLSFFLAYGVFTVWRYRSYFGSVYTLVVYTLWLGLVASLTELGLEFALMLYALSGAALSWLSTIKIEKYPEVQQTSFYSSVLYTGVITLLYVGNLTGPLDLFGILAMILVFAAWFLLGSKYRFFYYLTGIPWLLIFWHLGFDRDISSNLYYISFVSAYAVILGWFLQFQKQTNPGRAFELGGYVLQLLFMTVTSLSKNQATWEHAPYAIATIGLSALIIFGNLTRPFKTPAYVAIGFMILALIILFYQTVLTLAGLIPWYIYVFFIGLALILGAIYLLTKGDKNEPKKK
jgi:hypothetical protein